MKDPAESSDFIRNPIRARKTGLLVGSDKGETVLGILSKLDLVDYRYKIGRSKGKLRIPLSRRPTKEELEEIENGIGVFSIDLDDFEPQEKRPESLDEALSLLPPEVQAEIPRAFDLIGDLAVLELTPETEPYQGLIANALMTVHKNVRGVFGKAGPVSGEERLRPLRHLAGENRTSTLHREFGASFKLDIAKVFFSPRLSQEHQRVAELVQKNEHVIDMFAGVGPFAVLIAKRLDQVRVDAVDINPEAARFLEENVRLNHAEDKVRVWKANVRDVVQNKELFGKGTRVIMNHPSQSRVFLDAACQAFSPIGGVIHYYTFGEGMEAEHSAVSELEEGLERLDWNIEQTLLVRKVRGTSPMSWQVVVDAQVAPMSD